MDRLDAQSVANLLDELGRRLELTGESSFKVRAYHNGAEALRALDVPLADLIASRRLESLPGVGKALSEKIQSLHKTGTHLMLERLRSEVPDGLLELFALPGLGAKKVLALRDAGIVGIDALEAAIDDGRVAALKGFGPKLAGSLKAALPFARGAQGRRRMPEADAALAQALEKIRAWPGVERAEAAGEARRRCESVGTLEAVAATTDPAAVAERARELSGVRVIAADPKRFGAALVCASSAPAHLEGLRRRAAKLGIALGPDGALRGGKPCPTPDEASVYALLELPPIAPELREGLGELEAAEAGKLPKLLEERDLKGILHCHSTYSDGMQSVAQMAEAARALGMRYFGIADHSQSARYAGGLTPERVLQQHAEVDELNARYASEGVDFRIFKGIESDIREDGSLDYDDAMLARFDFVVASVHSQFQLDLEAQTKRICRAAAHPACTILGHPTGRLLLKREGYALDMERVLAACAKHGVAVEINAHPYRLDMDWRWHRRALELGAWLSVNPDAHETGELPMRYGVAMARKGGVSADRVLNALDRGGLEKWLERKRKQALKP
ncbi:MAG: DNA polymerase/3'-5' exonuclease PolX [Planctomycetes bacterium]|nr:DNA polymerase/3'-5' exonuclease PolX [Planctomycetota bacterium]